MSTGPTRMFEDMARLAGSAAGMASGLGAELQTMIRHQAERMVRELDLVHREEFEAMAELAANSKAEAEALAERVAKLEEALTRLQK